MAYGGFESVSVAAGGEHWRAQLADDASVATSSAESDDEGWSGELWGCGA